VAANGLGDGVESAGDVFHESHGVSRDVLKDVRLLLKFRTFF
jgi:hypothetical protein